MREGGREGGRDSEWSWMFDRRERERGGGSKERKREEMRERDGRENVHHSSHYRHH